MKENSKKRKLMDLKHFFREQHYYSYLQMKLYEPEKHNLCKQISLRAIELSQINFYNCKYICSLKAKLTHHAVIFDYLELLEYKATILKKSNSPLYQKYA